MNAAKPFFPTSVVGIVTIRFDWVGQGSPKEGFKAYTYKYGHEHQSKDITQQKKCVWNYAKVHVLSM